MGPALLVFGLLVAVPLAGPLSTGAPGWPGTDLSLELIKPKELKELSRQSAGTIRLFNFWATWCAPCIEEFPDLMDLRRRYEEQGLEFIAVSANPPEEREQVMEFLRKHSASGLNFQFAVDDTRLMMKAFDGRWKKMLPYTVLIDRENRIVYRKEGRVDPDELSRVIEEELSR
jgi:thiol-disulfide isomerase/thioredoxin